MEFTRSYSNLSAVSLIAGFAVLLVGVFLFLSRPAGFSAAPPGQRMIVERGAIGLAAILNAIGLLLLAQRLAASAGGPWALAGAYLFLVGSVVLVIAEALKLSQPGNVYPLIVAYICLALLAQAAIGLGIVLSRELPAPLGWTTIAWNIAWLLILPLATPADMYFPILHHLMPLAIGISLLTTR